MQSGNGNLRNANCESAKFCVKHPVIACTQDT